MVSCGSCVQARPGAICRNAIRPTRPVTAAFGDGARKGCSTGSFARWPKISRRAAGSIFRSASWTAPSWGLKRGSIGGKDQAGQGHEAHGALADGSGLPLAVCAASASPHEVTLVGATLEASFLDERPEKLIGDRAYDSDPLDEALAEEGIEMIAPHRNNRRKPKTQDGRKLRRYKRRWKIERLFAWLSNFRRLVVRYERRAENYLGMVKLGCIVILLRYS
jgi:transposase